MAVGHIARRTDCIKEGVLLEGHPRDQPMTLSMPQDPNFRRPMSRSECHLVNDNESVIPENAQILL